MRWRVEKRYVLGLTLFIAYFKGIINLKNVAGFVGQRQQFFPKLAVLQPIIFFVFLIIQISIFTSQNSSRLLQESSYRPLCKRGQRKNYIYDIHKCIHLFIHFCSLFYFDHNIFKQMLWAGGSAMCTIIAGAIGFIHHPTQHLLQ